MVTEISANWYVLKETAQFCYWLLINCCVPLRDSSYVCTWRVQQYILVFEYLRYHVVPKKLLFLWKFTEKVSWKVSAYLTVYYKSTALQ